MNTKNALSWIFVIVVVVVLVLFYYSDGGARDLPNEIYLPIVIAGNTPEKPMFNEQMVDLYYDTELSSDEWETWAYLDPSPHVADLQEITYTAPEGYRVKSAWFYSYDDGIYHSLAYSEKDVEGCIRAFTFKEGGPNVLIGGEWCVTHVTDGIPNIYGDLAYAFRNTSPQRVHVFMFNVKRDLNYCATCTPGEPPDEGN